MWTGYESLFPSVSVHTSAHKNALAMPCEVCGDSEHGQAVSAGCINGGYGCEIGRSSTWCGRSEVDGDLDPAIDHGRGMRRGNVNDLRRSATSGWTGRSPLMLSAAQIEPRNRLGVLARRTVCWSPTLAASALQAVKGVDRRARPEQVREGEVKAPVPDPRSAHVVPPSIPSRNSLRWSSWSTAQRSRVRRAWRS